MNLHSEIMNIPISVDRTNWLPLEKNGYAYGHRDARHSAAELSLKAEARIEGLEDDLKKAKKLLLNTVNPFASKMTAQEIHTAILNFLQENKQ